jgi:plastocyanin
MIRTRWRIATAGASLFMLGQLVIAAPVGATTGQATLTADMPSAVPAGRLWSFNDFFPRTVTVKTGSDLQFINEGFHTFTVLPAGDKARQDWLTNGAAVDDTDDTTLNPNGTTHAAFDIPALLPTCGPAPLPQCTFDGSSTINVSALGPPGPVDVHVSAQPGTYNFLCRIHPGMSGTLKVVAADAKVPSQAEVDQQVAKQVSKDLKGAWQADKKANHDAITQNKDGSRTLHVTAGTSSKDGKVALLEFFPRNLDAKPGDDVVFTPRSPNEPHTVTFPMDFGTDMINLCENGSSDTPFGPPDFSCPDHPGQGPDEVEFDGGNGVSHVTQPGLDGTVSDSGTIGSPREARSFGIRQSDILNSWTISLAGAAPGTYTYVCQIHDGMDATITVH